MKKILLVTISFLVCLSLNAKENINYTINGEITNKNKFKYAVLWVSKTKNQPVKIYHSLIKDGRFSFNGQVSGETGGVIMGLLSLSNKLLSQSDLEYQHQEAAEARDLTWKTFIIEPKVSIVINDEPIKKAKITGGNLNYDDTKLHEAIKDRTVDSFLETHSASPLSLYYISLMSKMPIGGAEKLNKQFNALSPQLRMSEKGIEVKKIIDKYANIKPANSTASVGMSLKSNSVKSISGIDKLLFNKNKYVVVHFWASWCAPCIKELPDLKLQINDLRRIKNIEVKLISIDSKEAIWKNAINNYNLKNYNNFLDYDKNNLIADKLGIVAIPFNLLIDTNGKIVSYGFKTADMETQLAKYIK